MQGRGIFGSNAGASQEYLDVTAVRVMSADRTNCKSAGESTDNVDLVGWVMAGVQHIPRSEDVPVVSNFGSSFAIRPWNMFNELASRIEYDDPSPKGCSAPIFGLNFPWPPPAGS